MHEVCDTFIDANRIKYINAYVFILNLELHVRAIWTTH